MSLTLVPTSTMPWYRSGPLAALRDPESVFLFTPLRIAAAEAHLLELDQNSG
jgi:hypothetical protein